VAVCFFSHNGRYKSRESATKALVQIRQSIAEAGRAQPLDSPRWESYAVVSLCMAKQDKLQEAAKFEALAVNHAPLDKRDQIRAALSSNGSATPQ
jgi:hypothetical protein